MTVVGMIDQSELEANDKVKEVKDSCESGVAYVVTCEEYNVGRLRVDFLKSDKWSPREGHRNGEHSYLKVAYHADYLN